MNNGDKETAIKLYLDAVDTIRHYDKERTATHRIAAAVLSGLLAFGSSNLVDPETTLVIVSTVGVFTTITFFLYQKSMRF